jgi:hypothetical protein
MKEGFHPDGKHAEWLEPHSSNLNWVFRTSCTEIVESLLAHRATVQGVCAVTTAAFHVKIDVLELLVKYEADFNEAGPKEQLGEVEGTPLHVADAAEREDVVRWLLAHGADVSLENADKKTAKDIWEEKGLVINLGRG